MIMMTLQNPLVWIPVAFIVGWLFGALVLWLWGRIRLQSECEPLKIQLTAVQTNYEALSKRFRTLGQNCLSLQRENEKLKIERAQLQKLREMREAFEALAGQTLQSNSGEFLKHAREQLAGMLGQLRGDWRTQKAELRNLVDPLKENLTSMDGYVRELERKREGAYQRLQEQLQNLATTHSELQTTTINLSQALKSPTVRGRWGEMQLRRVVEMAGMVKHVTYDEQVTTDGGRPDMIAYLPNGGVLPVDSKVPLAAYLDAMEAKDEETRRTKLGKHAKAMQDRIQELSQKKYWEQFDNTPDFVVMFVPNEACLGAAFEINPSLLEYGIEKHVLISTPVTLLALLRAVAYGWQQQQITENARQIAEQGRELYRRLETFIGHMAELRKDLNKTVDGYNKAVGSLERRLLPAARRFEEMGVTASELDAPQTIDTQAKLPTK